MLINLNFGGFYDSYSSQFIESVMFDEDQTTDTQYNDVDFGELCVVYAKRYVGVLNELIGLNLVFCGISSPKCYNFHTDTITIKISKVDISNIIRYIKNEPEIYYFKELLEYELKNASTQRPGYIPYNTYRELLLPENRQLFIEIVFDCILQMDEFDTQLLHENICLY